MTKIYILVILEDGKITYLQPYPSKGAAYLEFNNLLDEESDLIEHEYIQFNSPLSNTLASAEAKTPDGIQTCLVLIAERNI